MAYPYTYDLSLVSGDVLLGHNVCIKDHSYDTTVYTLLHVPTCVDMSHGLMSCSMDRSKMHVQRRHSVRENVCTIIIREHYCFFPHEQQCVLCVTRVCAHVRVCVHLYICVCVCACVYLYVCLCVLCVYCVCMCLLCLCMCVYMYFVCASLCASLRVCVFLCVCVCVSVVCVCSCVCLCMCVSECFV